MRRVTPISPYRDDIVYLLSDQEFVYDPDAPAQLEERLNELGWTVEDVEMNVLTTASVLWTMAESIEKIIL